MMRSYRVGLPLGRLTPDPDWYGIGAPASLPADFFTLGTTTPNTWAVATSGTAHAKGSWVEIDASLSADLNGFSFTLPTHSNYNDSSTLIDFAVGASGAESVIVGDVPTGYAQYSIQTAQNFIPVFVPAGSRFAVRVQGARTSTGSTLTIFGQHPTSTAARRNRFPTKLDTLGVNTATSAPTTTLTAPTSTNTKGAWTEIAVTSRPYRAVVGVMGVPAGASSAASNTRSLFDWGIGASGAEVAVFSNGYSFSSNSTNWNIQDRFVYLPGPFPAGTRFVARYQRSASTSHAAALIGVPA